MSDENKGYEEGYCESCGERVGQAHLVKRLIPELPLALYKSRCPVCDEAFKQYAARLLRRQRERRQNETPSKESTWHRSIAS